MARAEIAREEETPQVERRKSPPAPEPLAPQQQLEAKVTDTLRIVVQGLVGVAVLSIAVVGMLAWGRREIPAALIGIGSAAVGALATLVARIGRVNGA